jgi:hypothetical protein
MIYPEIGPQMQNLVLIGQHGWSGRMRKIFKMLAFYFFVLFGSRTGRYAERILPSEGSKCVFCAKYVPFWGPDDDI